MEQLSRLKEFLCLEIELFEEITSLYADLKQSLIEDNLEEIVEINKKLETKGLQFKLLVQQRGKVEEGISVGEEKGRKLTLVEIASSVGDSGLGAHIISLCGKYADLIGKMRALSTFNSNLLDVSRSSRENLGKIIDIVARKDATYGSGAELSQPKLAGVKIAERA
jgi:hypothetical protein